MSLTRLKAEAKELGIKGYTKYKLESIGELLALVEAKKEELAKETQEATEIVEAPNYDREDQIAEVIKATLESHISGDDSPLAELDENFLETLTMEEQEHINIVVNDKLSLAEACNQEAIVEAEETLTEVTKNETKVTKTATKKISKVKYNQIAKALGNSQSLTKGVYNNEIACMTTEKELLPEDLKEIMYKSEAVEVSELNIDTQEDNRKFYDRIKLNNGEYIVLDNSLSKMMLGGKRNQRTKVYFSQSSSSKVILENHGLYVSIAPVMCNLMHSA